MNPQQAHTILVADDEPGIRRVLKKRLVDWNFRVMTAENGRRAISLIQSDRPDVVITDLFMPEGDGFDLLRYIQETSPELPVIVISGQGELGDAIRSLRLGAWDYLYKPIEKMSFLQLAIERVLEKARILEENRAYRDHLEDLVTQKSAELLASEKRYRIVADFTSSWEYWIAPGGDIVYISPSCESITGYSVQAFIEDPSMLREIIHPEDRDRFDRHLNDSSRQKEVSHFDFRIARGDGEQRWIGHTCLPVYDLQGRYLGHRCSNRDITYQKKIENDLNGQKQALIEKTISQEKANEALKALLDQRDTEKKSIEQAMVVNLKRFVFPYLEDLERLNTGKDAKAYVNIIRNNIEQLISPVSKNLSGAYLELTPTEIKVADLIRQSRSTKSIAAILKTSPSTVEKHRNKIRKKLNILKKKVNLQTYLNSLT
jgi:PAS domain S-box-containing protein